MKEETNNRKVRILDRHLVERFNKKISEEDIELIEKLNKKLKLGMVILRSKRDEERMRERTKEVNDTITI